MAAADFAQPPDAGSSASPKVYRCGTLTYTQHELYVLFFWLMWNDFMITFLQDPIGFGGFLQKDYGATNTQIAAIGVIGGICNIFINPVFSVWSDRTRTAWGRRRPFLLAATPPLALFIILMPYMPDFAKYLGQFPMFADVFKRIPMNAPVLFVGVCTLLIGVFNSIVGTLFSYLYWDVVPQEVLGRWTSLTKIVGAAAGFIWQFFFFGLADHHLKALCLGVSIFSMTVYVVSLLKVKEGSYPELDPHKKGGPWFASIRAFFVECFSDPFYLWIFGAFAFASINYATGNYIGFYLKYNLHLDYDSMGKLNAWPGLLSIVLGYFLGSLTDRLHPIRIMAPTFFALGLIYVGSFFFVHDKWSYLFWTCLTTIAQFANGVTYGALLPAIFPREKFGQFCSANATCSTCVNLLLAVPLGKLFDLLQSRYRFSYLVAAFSMFGAALLFMKVHRNFDARQGRTPVPSAG